MWERIEIFLHLLLALCQTCTFSRGQVLTCSGFVKSQYALDFMRVEIQLFSKSGTLKEKTDCAPNNGYFLIPVYDQGEYTLRISPPGGWSFDPMSVQVVVDGNDDKCDDIVFQFIGFHVSGQVISIGQEFGPEGVMVQLRKKGSDKVLQETVSGVGGRFILDQVVPGSYQLSLSHALWTLKKDYLEVVVTSDSLELPSGQLVVLGYDAKGVIASGGEPVGGVQFLLYPQGDSVDATSLECGLNNPVPEGVPSRPSCVAVSAPDGHFSFPSLPPGDYRLVPYYHSGGSKFEVIPEEVVFSVFNDSVLVEPAFDVHGFSISGRVLTRPKGDGFKGAMVHIGPDLSVLTDHLGNYQLMNVSSGQYEVQVEAEHVEFDPVRMDISPANAVLPDIVPSRYFVCGRVIVSSTDVAIAARSLEAYLGPHPSAGKPGKPLKATITDLNGVFCFMLSPGEYFVKAVVSKEEEQRGVVLLPSLLSVTVSDQPQANLLFKQFTTTLSGSVKCLVACPAMEVKLQRVGENSTPIGGAEVVTVMTSGKSGKFTFQSVLPGSLTASILFSSWCLKQESVAVEVKASDSPQPISFIHSGFVLEVQSSHSTNLEAVLSKKKAQKLDISKGLNKICLAKPGNYSLIPMSCLQFESSMYPYNTGSPSRVNLLAVSHSISLEVMSSEKMPDIKVMLRYAGQEKVLTRDNVSLSETPDQYIHSFSFSGRPGSVLSLTPISDLLVCSPKTQQFTVGEECPESVDPFHCTTGLFVQGHIEPPLGGVSVTIATSDGSVLKAVTDSQGKYRVGPIHRALEHSVSVSMEQYVFKPLDGDRYSYKAMRLSRLTVKVLEDEKVPMDKVFISVSGGEMRSSNLTAKDGTVVYSDVSPGQYYIKPLFREYEFIPPSKVVDLNQGELMEVVFSAKRTAFSCTGMIMSPNRTPLTAVTVKTVGVGESSCELYLEEAISDDSGQYRFRGLVPGCNYMMTVDTGSSSPVEQSIPSERMVEVSDADITGEDFFVIFKPTTITVTGNVIIDSASRQYLNTIKVVIYQSDHLDTPLLAATLNPLGFFQFSPLPLSPEIMYFVDVETSLSHHLFSVTKDRVEFTANRDKHITLTFAATERALEPESSRGSFFGVILAVAVIFIAANVDKMMVLIHPLLSNILNSQDKSSEWRRSRGR